MVIGYAFHGVLFEVQGWCQREQNQACLNFAECSPFSQISSAKLLNTSVNSLKIVSFFCKYAFYFLPLQKLCRYNFKRKP